MKNKKTGMLIAFSILTGAMITLNSPRLTKAESNDLIIFENGEFCKEISRQDSGSSITDGKWHNDASWAASRVLLKEGIDLSNYESITLTYTNVGTANWVEFGIGNAKQYGELDYVTKGVSFISDGEEHNITYNIDDFASATTVNCTWSVNPHENTSLDMTSISGFCIKAGKVTVNVSKIIATPKVEDKPVIDETILKSSFTFTKMTDGENISKGIRFVGSVKEDKFANLSNVGFNFTLASTDKNVTKDYAVETTKLYNKIDDSNKLVFENKEDETFTLDGYLSYSLILNNISETFTATITFYSYAIIDGVTYNSETTTINIVNGAKA